MTNTNPRGRLAGKVALITGGARGQGAEEGRLFADEGATVVLTDVLDAEGEATAAGIAGASYHSLDVSSEEQWKTVVDAVVERHGRLDVVVNNAGIDFIKKLVGTTLEEYERVIAINQVGVFLGMRTAAEAMIAAETGGSIVNISSVAGIEGVLNRTAYSASKFAVTGMTKVAAKELGRHGIRVNSVHPGFIETPMTADLRPMTDPDIRQRVERSVPLGRYGVSGDIAPMVLFLASDESSYCTGQAFVVDGGVHR
ncbi:MAG: glucose 1-dehydrogenase [Actinomycetota bacterium]